MRVAAGDHVVQFYDGVDALTSVVAGYLAAAIIDGDAVVVFAVPEHRQAFRAALSAAGVDVDAVGADGRLLALDAGAAVAALGIGGSIDRAAFETVVGTPVRQAAARGCGVRVYGEIVALLWAGGNIEAAMDVERLWNELRASVPFSLFCGYPVELVATRSPARPSATSASCTPRSSPARPPPGIPR